MVLHSLRRMRRRLRRAHRRTSRPSALRRAGSRGRHAQAPATSTFGGGLRLTGVLAATALALTTCPALPHGLSGGVSVELGQSAAAAERTTPLHPAGSRQSVGRETLNRSRHALQAARRTIMQEAARARAARAAAVRATRSLQRPPLAERSHWAVKPKVPAAHRATHPVSKPPPMSDYERAESLPQPWRSIVRCESLHDGSWRVSSSSMARGWFQFLRSTWRSLGLSGDPAAASFDEQYAAARRLAQRDGLRAWDCARILGLA